MFSSDVSLSQEDYKKENCTILAEDNIGQDLSDGTVAALNNPEVVSGVEEEQGISGQDFISGDSSGEDTRRKKAVEYYVKGDETLSTIAEKFGISVNTILWANNLDYLAVIHPGDKLTIPPEDGLMYAVQEGDTLLAIAQKYGTTTSKIAEFNQLDADSIVEGQMLFLPGAEGIEAEPEPEETSSQFASSSSSSSSSSYYSSSSSSSSSYSTPKVRYGGGSHRFPYGYCTWYAAQRRGGVPWGGNAYSWLENARAAGYQTGNQPVPGSIMVTRESWWGHVAYVEGVSGNSVTVSEMNMRGWGIVSSRTINKNNWVIRGFIY